MFRSLNKIIQSLSSKQKLKKYFIYDKVQEIWLKNIDTQIQSNAKLINLNNDILIVQTTSPIWKTELGLQKDELLNIINNKLEQKPLIKDIRFL